MTADQILTAGDANIALGEQGASGLAPGVFDFSKASAAWQNVANQELAMRKAEYDKHLRELQDAKDKAAKDYTFDNSKVLSYDYPDLLKQQKEAADYATENASKIYGDPNSEESRKARDMMANALANINMSSQAEAMRKTSDEKYNVNPDLFGEQYRQQQQDWYKLPINERPMNPPQFNPVPKNDTAALGASFEKAITTGSKASSTSRKDQYGQIVNDITTTQQLDLTKLPELAKSTYNSNGTWKRVADQTWAQLDDAEKARLGSPDQTLVELTLPFINASVTEKKQFRSDWMAQKDAAKIVELPTEDFITFNATDATKVAGEKAAAQKRIDEIKAKQKAEHNRLSTQAESDELKELVKITSPNYKGKVVNVYGYAGQYFSRAKGANTINLPSTSMGEVHDLETGKLAPLSTKTPVIDVLAVTGLFKNQGGTYTLYTKSKPTQKEIDFQASRGATLERSVIFADADGNTKAVPYDAAIGAALRNIGLEVDETAYPQPTNSGSGGNKKYKINKWGINLLHHKVK